MHVLYVSDFDRSIMRGRLKGWQQSTVLCSYKLLTTADLHKLPALTLGLIMLGTVGSYQGCELKTVFESNKSPRPGLVLIESR